MMVRLRNVRCRSDGATTTTLPGGHCGRVHGGTLSAPRPAGPYDPAVVFESALPSPRSSLIHPRRWWFVGSSGSGKTTYARHLAAQLGVPHIEMDALFHQADWTPAEAAAFRASIDAAAAVDGWTMDGNYSAVRDLSFHRAEVMVALDFPRSLVMRQLIPRTLHRVVTQQELWNGNTESWSNLWRWDPTRSVIRWSWTRHAAVKERIDWYERLCAVRGTTFIRARSHAEVREGISRVLGTDIFLG